MSESDDARITRAMATELERKDADLEIAFPPITVLQFAALIQLALRHPDISERHREIGTWFLADVREYFADCPVTLEIIRRGDDPQHDIPRRGTSDPR